MLDCPNSGDLILGDAKMKPDQLKDESVPFPAPTQLLMESDWKCLSGSARCYCDSQGLGERRWSCYWGTGAASARCSTAGGPICQWLAVPSHHPG